MAPGVKLGREVVRRERSSIGGEELGLDVTQDEPVAGVVAHGLLNSLTAIEGLIGTARTLVDPRAPDATILDELLATAAARTKDVTTQLHQLVRGLPGELDLDELAAPDLRDRPPSHVDPVDHDQTS